LTGGGEKQRRGQTFQKISRASRIRDQEKRLTNWFNQLTPGVRRRDAL